MGFNRRKLEDQRREAAEKEAATRRATDAQVLQDAERLITAWNERQAKRMPMLSSPTIGASANVPRKYRRRCCILPVESRRACLMPHPRTPFHHQLEAQHPKS
jgi:hypothetical protein